MTDGLDRAALQARRAGWRGRTGHRAAAVLAGLGVTNVPDFLLGAGRVVHIHAVRSDWGDDRLEEAVRKIGGRVHDVLALARSSGKRPVDVAEEPASARPGRSVGLPA
jgi:hypothetical protein